MAYGPGPSTADILRQQQLNRERELAEANRLQPQPQAQQPQPSAITKLPFSPQKSSPFTGVRSIDASIQYDKEGRPIRNPYLSMLDAEGKLLNQYSLADKIGADIQLDNTGYDMIKQRATSTSPSAWAMLQKQRNEMELQNQLGQSAVGSQAATNGAWNQMAARGGLSAGQRMRLASQGGNNAFKAQQQLRNQSMMGNLNVDLQDQQSKDQMLQQLPGLSMQNANFLQGQRDYRNQAFNKDLNNSMNDLRGYNAYNSDAYNQAMSAWGADKTASAQERASRSGSSGGLLSNIFGGLF
jgi:hypothetical protein